MTSALPFSSQVPKVKIWALLCPAKPPLALSVIMAGLEGAPKLIYTCSVNAACLGVLFIVELSLKASCSLVLAVACLFADWRQPCAAAAWLLIALMPNPACGAFVAIF